MNARTIIALGSALAVSSCSSSAPAPCDGGACASEPIAAAAVYRDQDPKRGTSGGLVRVTRAADESSVDEYVAHWVDDAKKRLGIAGRAKKTGADLDVTIAPQAVPATASGVLVVTSRAGSDAKGGVLAGPADNFVRVVDVGANGPAATAPEIIAGADRLLVVATAAADMERVLLFSCASDVASACSTTTINGPPQCGRAPSGAIDADANRLLIVAAHGGAGNRATMLGCATDGTDCALADLSSGQGSDSGLHPRALIDAAAGRLLVVARNEAAGSKPWLYRCNTSGTGCVARDVSAALGAFSTDAASRPSAALGAGALYVSWATASGVALVRCGADGSGCAGVDLGSKAGLGAATAPSVAFDASSSSVLVAVESAGKPMLARCGADLASCSSADVSAGQAIGAPALALDDAHGKLWIAGASASGAALVRCERDATGCAAFPLMASAPASRASLALDATRAWVALDDGAPTHLVLFSLGLW